MRKTVLLCLGRYLHTYRWDGKSSVPVFSDV